MSNRLVHIADKVLNQPLLLTPAKAEIIASVLGGRIGLEPEASPAVVDERSPSASRFRGVSRGVGEGYGYTEYYRLIEGVAVITIDGALLNKGAWIGASSGLVSYEGIRAQIDLAMGDPDVCSILLVIQSPGGEVYGCFELGNHISRCCETKPIHAIADGMACSAAYVIGSSCDHLTAIQAGDVGSIGVVVMHVDQSERLDAEGIKPTLIHAGAHKVDGHPFAPLPEDVKADWQKEINQIYDQFVAHVADQRPVTAEQARATEARSIKGPEALELGLIDMVGSFDDALSNLIKTNAVSLTAQERGLSMTNKNGQAGASGDGFQMTQAEHDSAVAQARADGFEQGKAEGAKAERERVQGIFGADAYKDQPEAAAKAVAAGLTVEQAEAMAPTAAPAAEEPNKGDLVNQGGEQYMQARRDAQAQQPSLGAGSGAQNVVSFSDVMAGHLSK